MLPVIKDKKKLDLYTPTAWQTVLLRNLGLVSDEKLAAVLGTDAQTVRREAERLGIAGIKYDPNWRRLGYINIIKGMLFVVIIALSYDRGNLKQVVFM